MARGIVAFAVLAAALFHAGPGSAQTGVPASAAPAGILAGLAERTRQYYDRFISIICTETVHSQNLKSSLAPVGKPRVTAFELSVARNAEPDDRDDFRVDRILLSVNGKPARRNQEPGCTDPKTGSPEPLGFLLSKNQPGYRFAIDELASGGPPGARALNFMQWPSDSVSVKWTDNCFAAHGGGEQGRVWFDPATYDVLELNVQLPRPFIVPMAPGLRGMQSTIRVERWEMTVRFSRVAFEKPDEVVLLPDSIETLSVIRGTPSLRTSQKLTNFRRFLAESKIRSADF